MVHHFHYDYLTASGSSNVEYVFKNKCFEFAINRTPAQLRTAAITNNAVKLMSLEFSVRFMSNNRILNASATGPSGCIFAFSKLKSAGTILNDQQYVNAGVTGIVTEIYLDTPDNLVLATDTALTALIPGF